MHAFIHTYDDVVADRSSFCLGLDPSDKVLQAWGLPCDLDGLTKFSDTMLKAAGESLAFVKPQSAYFEQFGPDGMRVMQKMCRAFQERGTFVIMDAKRGDIGSTNMGYAKAYFGPNSPYHCDALTVTAYLGIDALEELFTYAAENDGMVYVVVRSSNPEGSLFQNAKLDNGQKVYEYLAEKITAFNEGRKEKNLGPVGAVIGATIDNVKEIAEMMPYSSYLCPGIGFQGATYEDFGPRMGESVKRAIPIAARGVLLKGPDEETIREEIKKHIQASRAL